MVESEDPEPTPRPPHPAEALVARLLSPDRGDAWVQFRREMYERRLERARLVLKAASDAAGIGADDLLELSVADERRADLLDAALDSAMRTAQRSHLRGLGRVLAAGVTADNDTKVDASIVVERILAGMDPPHIRALALISEVGAFNPGLTQGADGLGSWLQGQFPGLGEVANQVGAFLTGNGLVTNPFYVNGALTVTTLGNLVLELVRDEDEG